MSVSLGALSRPLRWSFSRRLRKTVERTEERWRRTSNMKANKARAVTCCLICHLRTANADRCERPGFEAKRSPRMVRRLYVHVSMVEYPDYGKKLLFREYAEEWERVSANQWSAKTHGGYASILTRHLLPWFGDRDLKSRWRDVLVRRGVGEFSILPGSSD